MKHNLRLKMLLGATLLLASTSAHAESQPLPQFGTIQAEFPAPWMEHMIYAYEDFKTKRDDLSCFSIWAYKVGDSYFVSIAAPNMGVEVEGGVIKIPVVPGATPCGRGVKYEFDGTGKFIKRIGIK